MFHLCFISLLRPAWGRGRSTDGTSSPPSRDLDEEIGSRAGRLMQPASRSRRNAASMPVKLLYRFTGGRTDIPVTARSPHALGARLEWIPARAPPRMLCPRPPRPSSNAELESIQNTSPASASSVSGDQTVVPRTTALRHGQLVPDHNSEQRKARVRGSSSRPPVGPKGAPSIVAILA